MGFAQTALTCEPAVVIGRKGNVGQSHFFASGCWPTDTTYFALLPDGVDPRFLTYQLEHLNLRRLDQSTTTPSLRREDLEAQLIVLPDLAEQRRIGDILEEHLTSLDAGERSLDNASRRAAALFQSTLHIGLVGGLVEDDLGEGTGHDLVASIAGQRASISWLKGCSPSWSSATLGELFLVGVGSTPPRSDQNLWRGDLAWVSSGEVAFGRIAATRETIARSAAGNPATRIHPPGTVLLAMIGEGKTRGQAAILDIEAAHNQNCASIRVSDTAIMPEFVYYFLQERYLETRRGASGGNQPALNKARVQAISMPVPPLGTQRRLVAAFDDQRLALDRLKAMLGRGRTRVIALRRALLAAAFSGQLTGRSSDTEIIEDLADQEA